MVNSLEKTCVNRFLKTCRKNCTLDYDPNHYPNNSHCPRHHELHVVVFEIDYLTIRNMTSEEFQKIFGDISNLTEPIYFC